MSLDADAVRVSVCPAGACRAISTIALGRSSVSSPSSCRVDGGEHECPCAVATVGQVALLGRLELLRALQPEDLADRGDPVLDVSRLSLLAQLLCRSALHRGQDARIRWFAQMTTLTPARAEDVGRRRRSTWSGR